MDLEIHKLHYCEKVIDSVQKSTQKKLTKNIEPYFCNPEKITKIKLHYSEKVLPADQNSSEKKVTKNIEPSTSSRAVGNGGPIAPPDPGRFRSITCSIKNPSVTACPSRFSDLPSPLSNSDLQNKSIRDTKICEKDYSIERQEVLIVENDFVRIEEIAKNGANIPNIESDLENSQVFALPNGWKKICTKSAKTGKGWEVKLINPNRELINKYVINDIQFCYEKSRGLKFKKCVLCHFHAVEHKPDLIINHYKDKHGFDNLNLRSLVLSEFIFEKMLHPKYVKV